MTVLLALLGGQLPSTMGVSPVALAATATGNEQTRAQAAYTANAQEVLRAQPQLLAEMAFITKALQESPTADATRITQIMVDARKAWDEQRAMSYADVFSDVVHMTKVIADSVGDAGGPYGKVVAGAYDALVIPRFDQYLEQWHQAADRTLAGEQWQILRTDRGRQIIEDFYKACRANGSNAYICDTIMGPALGAAVTDSAAQICGHKSDLGGCAYLQKDKVSVEQAFGELTNQLASMQGVTEETLDTLHFIEDTLGQGQQTLLAWVENETARRQAEQKAAEVRARHEAKIQIAEGTVSILSSLVGIDNPKLGREIAVTGNAAIQIADNVSKFMDSAAKVNRSADSLQKLQATAGAVLSMMNIVGAGIQILSLFQATGPSPDARILEELQKISQQVEELRTEMHDRFNRLDASLNKIYDRLHEMFTALDFKVGIIHGDVAEIQRGLLGLEADLNRVQRNLYTFLASGFAQELLLEVNNALGYFARTGTPLAYSDFAIAEGVFQTWAKLFSSDPLRAGPLQRDYTASGLLAEWDNFSLSENVNFLAQYPRHVLGLPALASGRLPSPMILAFATSAWVQLLKENPEHAARIAPFRLQEMRNTARALDDALAKIPDKALFQALLNDYRQQVAVVTHALEDLLTIYQSDPQRKLATVNLWHGAQQVTSYRLSLTSLPPCDGSGSPLPPLDDFIVLLDLDAVSLNAASLGLGQFTGCYRVFWDTLREQMDDNSLPSLLFARWREKIGRLNVAIELQLTGAAGTEYYVQGIVTPERCMNAPQLKDGSYAFPDPVAWQVLVGAWRGSWSPPNYSQLMGCFAGKLPPNGEILDNLEQYFQEHAAARYTWGPDDWQTHASLTASVEQLLLKHQEAYYTEVMQQLQSVTPVNAAVQRLTASTRALESFVSMGLPQAMSHNDFLRAMLLGSERLPDTDMVISLYQDAVARLQAGESPPKVDLATVAGERVDALENVLMTTLDRIATGEIQEGHPFLEALETQMQVMAYVVGVAPTSPPQAPVPTSPATPEASPTSPPQAPVPTNSPATEASPTPPLQTGSSATPSARHDGGGGGCTLIATREGAASAFLTALGNMGLPLLAVGFMRVFRRRQQ